MSNKFYAIVLFLACSLSIQIAVGQTFRLVNESIGEQLIIEPEAYVIVKTETRKGRGQIQALGTDSVQLTYKKKSINLAIEDIVWVRILEKKSHLTMSELLITSGALVSIGTMGAWGIAAVFASLFGTALSFTPFGFAFLVGGGLIGAGSSILTEKQIMDKGWKLIQI